MDTAPSTSRRLVLETTLDMFLDSAGVLNSLDIPDVTLLAASGTLPAGAAAELVALSVPLQPAGSAGIRPGVNDDVRLQLFEGNTVSINGVTFSGATAELRPDTPEEETALGADPPLLRFKTGLDVSREGSGFKFRHEGYENSRLLVTIGTIGAGREVGTNLGLIFPRTLPPSMSVGLNIVDVEILKPQVFREKVDQFIVMDEATVIINGVAYRTHVTLLPRF